MMHGFTTKNAVKQYIENTLSIAGDYIEKAELDLEKFKGKLLPIKLVVFLRKINPTFEDLMNEDLKKITFHDLFPDKFPTETL